MLRMKWKKIVSLILLALMLITSCFSFFGCLGSSSGGGGGGSSSGGGDDGASDDAVEMPTTDEPMSENEDDYFSGVLIMYDAGHNGEFYDKIIDDKVAFTKLLDREIGTFTTHLLYALNVVYGDDSSVTSNAEDTVFLTELNSELSALYKTITPSVRPATILADSASTSIVLNTNEFDKNKELLASSITNVANLGAENVEAKKQLNFNNAIKGGYVYKVDGEAEQPTGSFTNEINAGYAWNMDITNSVENENIKTNIANILKKGEYKSGDSLDEDYDTCLEDIEYLGFSLKDLANISEYVLNVIIGGAYQRDEVIRQSIPMTAISFATTYENQDIFSTNTECHYYRAYKFAVNLLVERMANITVGGLYTTSEDFSTQTEINKEVTYMVMPRTNIEIKKCSEIFSETNKVDEDMEFDMDNFDINTIVSNPLLENVKLKQIVFIPKLSVAIKLKYIIDLKEKYGDDYQSHVDYRFDITSINFSLRDNIEDEPSRYRVLPKFTIVAEGETVHSDKVTNESAMVNTTTTNPIDTFFDDYALMIDSSFKPAEDLAGYTISDAMTGHKFADYNGVEVFVGDGSDSTPNEEYFKKEASDNYLIVNNGASILEDSNAIYSVNYNEFGEFVFVFNGGDNFLQIDFEYFNETNSDLYDDDKTDMILPPTLDLMTLSIYT